MKKTLLTSIAALLLATGTAHAQNARTFRPPPKYDHPFDGLVMIQRASKEQIAKRCPSSSGTIPALACQIKFYSKSGTLVACLLILPSDDFLNGIELRELYRHEIGHCNGWSGHNDQSWELKPRETIPMPGENVDVVEEGCL